MEDEKKTKRQLIKELNELRQCETELKVLKEEIEQTRVNQEKFTKAFLQNSIPVGITTLDEGRFVDVSNAFLILLGRNRDEVVGHTSTEIGFITEDQRVMFFDELNKKGRVEDLEMKVRTKDGALRDGLFNAVMMTVNNEKCLLTVMIDVTKRKLAEEKSEDMLNFLQTLINTIPSPIFCKDINGLYKDCNKEFEDYTGLKKEEIIGKGIYDMYPKDVADKYHEMDSALFRQPGRQIYEHPIIYADGKKHDVVVNKATYLNADGTLAGLVGVMVDITARKQAEDELAKYRARLEQLVEERTEELENKTKALEELNIALRVLLRHREEDKKELEDRFVMNVKNLIIPFAEKMKSTHLDERQLAYLGIIETHLNDITTSMIKKMHQFNFTPTEAEVASLIKEGKATKKISLIMGIAASSINTHRNNIRKKLGISKKDVNLRVYLQSFN